jgi:PBSX family phage portal protein
VAGRPEVRVIRLGPEDDVISKAEQASPSYMQKAGIQSNLKELEDEFAGVYESASSGPDGQQILQPPFDFRQLEYLCQTNNALMPCIEAMKANIDGTGYEIVPDDGEASTTEDDTKAEALEAFFAEPWPGVSFMTQRKQLRDDLEKTGNAYLEVIPNALGEVVFLRHVEAKTVRMVRLDRPVFVEKELTRGGKTVKVQVAVRERRFVQRMNNQYVYFKEFGASRELNRNTGRWINPGDPPPAPEERATALLHFTLMKDVNTPYGIPRWVTQTPSVLGSRKAEEHNLSFFDSGGVPPLLVIVQGGAMTTDAVEALKSHFDAKAKNKHRAAVIEAHASSGSLESPDRVKVTVERFGSERQADSMFENYDEKCEERIRRAFRLPQLFIGKSNDHNFATAVASYTVAEAQVFGPERQLFDEVINLRLMPAIGGKGYKFRSLPLTVKDSNLMLQGLTLAQPNLSGEEVIDNVNEITGLDLTYDEKNDPAKLAMQHQQDIDHKEADAKAEAAKAGLQDPNNPAQDNPQDPKTGDTGAPSLAQGKGSGKGGITAPPKPGASLAKAEITGVMALAIEVADAMDRGIAKSDPEWQKLMSDVVSLSNKEAVAPRS